MELETTVDCLVQLHVIPATPESQDMFAPTPDIQFHIANRHTQEIIDVLEQGPGPKLLKSQKKVQKKKSRVRIRQSDPVMLRIKVQKDLKLLVHFIQPILVSRLTGEKQLWKPGSNTLPKDYTRR